MQKRNALHSTFAFCIGSPECETCGASHAEGAAQRCPAPKATPRTKQKSRRAVKSECPHLREPTGSAVALKKCICGAQTAVFKCELHTLCLPFASKRSAPADDSIRKCVLCEDNPANAAKL